MTPPYPLPRSATVPSDRLSRALRLGGLAGGLAGRVVAGGLREVAGGRRPSLADLLLTPANAARVARELAQMRGAVMKIGQLMSMDAGEVLPPDLAEIFARLRADADHMPPKQVQRALDAAWGKGWISRFARFDVRPLAAASIGQVHRAQTRDGRDLAIKIQYPGIRASIDSDLRNVAALMRLAPGLPATLDYEPLLAEARRQLHEEADYTREARYLAAYGAHLAGDAAFRVPGVHADLCTADVLAMDYVESTPLEALVAAPQGVRDAVMARLITLVLRELFEFGLMQTDPNFANYRHEADTGAVVLLDLGAARDISGEVACNYRRLLNAGLDADRAAARAAALDMGLFGAQNAPRHQDTVLELFEMAMAPLRSGAVFDLGTSDLAARLRDKGLEIGTEREFWHVPPADTLFVQRKVAGMFLLGARLKARVDVGALVRPWR